jgi:hypothetical protein
MVPTMTTITIHALEPSSAAAAGGGGCVDTGCATAVTPGAADRHGAVLAHAVAVAWPAPGGDGHAHAPPPPPASICCVSDHPYKTNRVAWL